jgi:hypothetical protein
MCDLKKIKKKGWSIKHSHNNFFLLEYSAGVLGELGANYLVNKEVYDFAKHNNINLEELVKKFDILNKCKKLYEIGEKMVGFKVSNTDSEFNNGDFIVTFENNNYFIKYQLSRQGGRMRKFRISKKVYEDAKTGNYSTSDLFKKYNLYEYDIPENDL